MTDDLQIRLDNECAAPSSTTHIFPFVKFIINEGSEQIKMLMLTRIMHCFMK